MPICALSTTGSRATGSVIGWSACGLNTVLAGIFHSVHGFVGGRHQFLGRSRRVGQRRQTDGGRQADVEAVASEKLVGGNTVSDTLADRKCTLSTSVGQ